MILALPIRTVSVSNAHELPFARAIRAKRERKLTAAIWSAVPNLLRCQVRNYAAWRVNFVRCSPGFRPLDDDNLPGSLKSIRDEVASCLGVDDGDPRIEWTYAQIRTEDWGVIVEITERGGAPHDERSGEVGAPGHASGGAGGDSPGARRASPKG